MISFFRYTIPNVETENFTFDRESGILQEADDEREFYQRVVLPKTKDLPFRSYTDQQEEVDYEVSSLLQQAHHSSGDNINLVV